MLAHDMEYNEGIFKEEENKKENENKQSRNENI